LRLEAADQFVEDELPGLTLKFDEDHALHVLDSETVQDKDLVQPVVVCQVRAEAGLVTFGDFQVWEEQFVFDHDFL
jgi:hypothetical protein